MVERRWLSLSLEEVRRRMQPHRDLIRDEDGMEALS